ncbi:MAG: DUF3131 domain-containing protein [Deltaproteobacteria bacterium]|nr:DUF3131 domain-containing protein [Deltaproteobacteria bacterium]
MKKFCINSLIVLVLFSSSAVYASQRKDVLDKSQIEFLDTLMRDTWNFIDYACDPVTGIPQNFQDRTGHGTFTNSTPVGLYIASLAAASEIGLIGEKVAEQKFERLMTSMEKLHLEYGFFPNFFFSDFSSIPRDGVMIISDYNIYPVGLVIARQRWPQFAKRISTYLDSIEWERLYTKKDNTIVWGYDLGAEKAVGSGLWLACDARAAVTMMIGEGVAPANVWDDMIRDPMEAKTGTIYQPGNRFGVTYISAITGLFFYEYDTEVGETVGNLGWHQYKFSRKRGYPLWGWSNCNIPGREYTEMGYIPEWTVTPHALALLIDYYPRHVTAALQKMQKLGGEIPPEGFEDKKWGLRGCYDMQRNYWGDKYLQLEQGMMFIALANFLHDNMVRQWFVNDPLIKKGLKLSKPYIKHHPELLKRWEKRDAQPIVQMPMRMMGRRQAVAETVKSLDLSKFVSHQPDQLKITHRNGSTIFAIDGKKEWKELACSLTVPSIDIEGLDRVEFEIDVLKSDGPEPGSLRLTFADKFGQDRLTMLKLDPEKKHYSIDARDIYGFFLDDDIMTNMTIIFSYQPIFYHKHRLKSKKIALNIKSIKFITKE